jgi:hypothetical protein
MTQRIAKQRIITFSNYENDEIHALTHMEFHQQVTAQDKTLDDITPGGEWADYVWQWALSKDQAIANHFDKIDEWQMNPDKKTY